MRRNIAMSALALVMLLPVSACHESENRKGDMQSMGEKEPAGMPEPGMRAAWSQLKRDMTPDEVLTLLGDPTGVKIQMTFTYWFYSPERESGPYVYFSTRPMTVIGWREP